MLLSRLSHRLTVLTGGGQDVPLRQKTLRDTIMWSYDLLTAEEQTLFRRLAVFVNGCQLEAIEALGMTFGDLPMAALDRVTQLVDKSLLQQNEEKEQYPRLFMLEIIREFALEMLVNSGEMERVQKAHATYYITLAERAEPELYHHHQGVWLARLEQDHENMRAALTFLQTHGEWLKLARLIGTLGWFWYMHGFLNEGRQWVEHILAADIQHLPDAVRGKVISAAGVFAGFLGQGDIAFAHCQESLPLCKALGDLRNVSASVYMLVHSLLAMGDVTAARKLAEETLTFVHAAGDHWAVGALCCMVGSVNLYERNFEQAWQWHQKGIAIFEVEGDICMGGLIRMMVADVAVAQGDEIKARMLIEQGSEMFRQVGASWSLGNYFNFWGQIALRSGSEARARFLLHAALQYHQQMGDQQGMVNTYALLTQVAARERDYGTACTLADQGMHIARSLKERDALVACLEGLAAVVAEQGEARWATQLWGAIECLYQSAGLQISQFIRESRAPLVKAVRHRLGEQAFTSMWAKGQKMTPEQVLAAQSSAEASLVDKQPEGASLLSGTSDSVQLHPNSLTRRELDVLWHLAQGLTNAQIAELLVITPTTVNSYLRTIYSKLGVTSRTAAMRYALDHKLI